MDKIDAINFMEQWADRWGVRLQAWKKPRPGEQRVGWARQPAEGEQIPWEAMRELAAMGNQLTFSEMGPPPAEGPACGSAGGSNPNPPLSITEGRVTKEAFKGFQVGDEDSLFAGVDQVSCTGHGQVQLGECIKMLQGYLGEGQPGFAGKNWYRESHRFDCGAMVCFTPGREDFSVVLRGQSMRQVGQERHRAFIVDLWEHTSYATRVDIRVDDYSRKLIQVDHFVQAYQGGNWSGARKAKIIEEKSLVKGGGARQSGAGVMFGTRSGARLLVYDKGLESKGEILSNRAEMGYYDDRAKEAWERLSHAAVESEGAFVRSMGELVTGPVDFRNKSGKVHLARMERLDWWQALIDALGSLRLKVVKPVSSLMSCARAVTRQYLNQLARMAIIAEREGRDFYHALFTEIDQAREGQELHQVPVAPREVGFDVGLAFKSRLWRLA